MMKSTALTERCFAETIAEHGGRVFRVGGCVRDKVMGTAPKDIDFCIVGMVKKNFKLLFPEATEYGKSFPVFRLEIDGALCELAFARTERKVGPGYKGFKISSNPKVKIEDDLFRRDTTVNSMAVDCLTGEMIDPYHGLQDIQDKMLRATSCHFADDPMRALRLAGQSARLGFAVDDETMLLATAARDELKDEPMARMMIELTKVLETAQQPSRFFRVLAEAKLLDITFPEIAALEVMDFAIAMDRLDSVATVALQSKVRFATLGLALSTEQLYQWNQRMTLPGDWLDAAIRLGTIRSLLSVLSPENIVTAIYALGRGALSVEEFDSISQGAGLPIIVLKPLKSLMYAVPNEPPLTLQGKEIGQWLREKHLEALSNVL